MLFLKDKKLCLVSTLLGLSLPAPVLNFWSDSTVLTLFSFSLYEGRAYIGTIEDLSWQESFP